MELEELLRAHRVPCLSSGHHHCRHGWIQIKHCPYCGSDNYHLGYNVAGRFFTCWRCRWHSVKDTLRRLNVPATAIATFLRTSSPLNARQADVQTAPRQLQVPKHVGPLLPAHRNYCLDRGFNPDELVERWQIGGIGVAARLAWRLYIPIILNGEQVSWTTRSVRAGAAQRYLSAKSSEEVVPHKQTLYGVDYCLHTVVVVEGPTDVWAVGPGAVALYGLAFTEEQVARLAAFPYRYICLDRGREAQSVARKLAKRLSVFQGVTVNIELTAKDPGEASRSELNQLRRFTGLVGDKR